MAKKQTKEQVINDLLPNSLVVRMDGKDVRVAMDKAENNILNMLLVAQLRNIIQNSIKSYEDKEVIPTPRELRDLAGAVRDANEASNAIYEKIELPSQQRPEKQVEQVLDAADFSKLGNTPEVVEPAKEETNEGQ
jgi:hypothetical protein